MADPATAYRLRWRGRDGFGYGTSAAAPLWAALMARINQALAARPGGGRVGFVNPLLYSSVGGTDAFHDVLVGTNGAYHARPGWDACTGWGSPRGVNPLQALRGAGG